MVVGFDGSRAFLSKKTGTENYSYQLLKALAKIDRKNNYTVYIRPEISVGKDWPKNFQFSILNFPFLWTQLGLSLQTFKDKLDVLFVPAHTLPIIRKPGLKTVVTVHDLGSEYLPSMHQLKQRLYLGLMQKFQLKTADYIISVSNATKEDLIKRIKIDPKKMKVVYEGFDKDKFKMFFKLPSAEQKSKIKIDQTIKKYNLQYQKYFMFVGTVQPRKNLERLIRAFSLQLSAFILENKKADDRRLMTDDLQLVIVGSKGWLSDEIYQLPRQLGIEDRVSFLGYVPEKDLPVLYSGALALTFPSLFEGFGLPILEAQACGCAVLTSKISSMPEVAGKGAIFVNPYSTSDIVEGMIEATKQDTRSKIIKAGLENVRRFSWEKCAAQTLAVLEEAVN